MGTHLYNRGRDMKFFNHINMELINRIIDNEVILYKINLVETETNTYGESSQKTYSSGVIVPALIVRDPQTIEIEDFGSNTLQNIIVRFHREYLESISLYPEIGDVIEWGEAYYEISQPVENQMVGGQYSHNFSIITTANMVSRDALNIENVRVGRNYR